MVVTLGNDHELFLFQPSFCRGGIHGIDPIRTCSPESFWAADSDLDLRGPVDAPLEQPLTP